MPLYQTFNPTSKRVTGPSKGLKLFKTEDKVSKVSKYKSQKFKFEKVWKKSGKSLEKVWK